MTKSDLFDLRNALDMLRSLTAAQGDETVIYPCSLSETQRAPVRGYLQSWVIPALERIERKWAARLAKK